MTEDQLAELNLLREVVKEQRAELNELKSIPPPLSLKSSKDWRKSTSALALGFAKATSVSFHQLGRQAADLIPEPLRCPETLEEQINILADGFLMSLVQTFSSISGDLTACEETTVRMIREKFERTRNERVRQTLMQK